jgi:hypothetical protein
MLPIWALLFTAAFAYANGGATNHPSAKPKRSGASSMMDPLDFSSCVKESVQGSKEGKCAANEENPSCLGLKKSLEYFREKHSCLHWRGTECQEWGSRGKTQAQWMAIAAGHLSKFGVCIRKRYGSEDDNGLKAAAADRQLLQALRKMQDGASVLGYLEGELLPLALSGDRFSQILQVSTLADDYKPHDFYRIKDAADNPAKMEFLQLTEDELQSRRANYTSEEDPFYEFVEANQSSGPISVEVAGSEKTITPQELKKNPDPARTLATLAEAPKTKVPLNNPYTLGLDRSLFERISIVYQKRAHEFRSVDDLVKSSAPPARDVRELLNRGETL